MGALSRRVQRLSAVWIIGEDMMFCTNCGKEIKENRQYCTNCGKSMMRQSGQENYISTSCRQPRLESTLPLQYEHPEQAYLSPPHLPGSLQIWPQKSALSSPQILGILAVFIAIIGALLPWFNFSFISIIGIESIPGISATSLAIVAAVLIYLGKNNMALSKKAASVSLMGVIILLVAAYYTYIASTASHMGAGSGLFVTAVGGIMLVVAGAWWLQEIHLRDPYIHANNETQPPQHPPTPPRSDP